jgi:Protein of unknown function (DUF3515)
MDPLQRRAARAATLVAVPVAIAIVVISVLVYGGSTPPAAPPGSAPAGPVEMTARTLAADAVPVCQEVVSRLPAVIGGFSRRPVSAGSEQNAAYGDPPITVACGTAQPTVEPAATVYPLSGVCWYAETRPEGTSWTTVDRTVPITVTVPGPSEGSAQSVIPFSAAVAANDPPRDAVPPGCR